MRMSKRLLYLEGGMTMADYGIYRVRFNMDRSKIREVHVYNIKGNTININESMSLGRDSLISRINTKNKFVTLIKDSEGYLQIGAEVNVYHQGQEDFVKIEENGINQDQLGKMSEY